ncbi:puromycin-sensitive aminopeptidase-like [Oppia nitens]|uniref:puromycin-sensitive aminopeptidase-like n=1 Tax=Oppia nitens TaxID=1686743 RepID=UPI0023DB7AD8|nr:puromycin-sensitive aminopeptidase-like [Oppia nitens]
MSGVFRKSEHRLPSMVTPINYDIKLRPNLQSFQFSGNETIKVRVNEETKQIVLNANELTISSATFTTESGQQLAPQTIEMSADMETSCLNFGQLLPIGSGLLTIDFSGTLNDKMKGFYRSKYSTPEGEDRYAATTQFEATGARQAFPCWDEPAFKATFDITLEVPKNRVALSNMNVISEVDCKDDKSLKVVKFDTSPVMSTYLVAFIVGEYDYIEDKCTDGLVTVRVYTPIGKKDQGLFALKVATKTLPYYKQYFNSAYQLPKMDLITVADYSGIAMENWGLVIYRETCLLVDPMNTSLSRKQYIALLVAHELSHQWFGNLVTMDWWTHLWLKEGVANFIEYLCVDHLFPDYQIWTQFVSHNYIPALESDALHNSHPIEVPVGHPSEIDEIFDNISYYKGASIVHMLYKFIGDELFRKGMRLYLDRHQYKNTITEDLWTALQEASDRPVRDVMNTWTKQKGFPVITVSSRRNGNSLILTLTQEKFCADGKLPPSESSVLWMIPISIIKGSEPDKVAVEALMDGKQLEISIPNVADNEWIKLNPECIGFYRVNYSPELLNLFLPSIYDKTLQPLNRLDLQNDLFALVESGQASTVDILKWMNAFANNEDNYTVWNSINGFLEKLHQLLADTDVQPKYYEFGRQLLSKIFDRLGWQPINGETHSDTLLRSLIINRLAAFEDPTVLAESKKLFDLHLKGTDIIEPDLRDAIYRAVAVDCDDQSFEALFKLYRDSDLHEEKNRLSIALGSVRDVHRIDKVLDFSLSSEVRSQDSAFVIISVALSSYGRDRAWKFFKYHKTDIRCRYDSGFILKRLVKYVSENFTTEDKLEEVKTFFNENLFPGTERTVQQSIENIRLNIEWLARDLSLVIQFLAK